MQSAVRTAALMLAVSCAVAVSATSYARITVQDDAGDIRFGAAADVRLSRDAPPTPGAPAALHVNSPLNVDGAVNVGAGGVGVAGNINATGVLSASNVIATALTLNVPSGQFPALLDALNWLNGKALLAVVTIRIAENTYNAQPNFVLSDLAAPEMVRIYGNIQTPSLVQLNQAAAGSFFTFDGAGANGIVIAGVTLNAAGSSGGSGAGLAGTVGITVGGGAAVSTRGLPLVLNGFERAVAVKTNAQFQAPSGSLTAAYCGKNCILANERAYVYAPQCTLSGTSASAGLAAVEVGASAFVSVVGAVVNNFNVGVWCDGTGDSADYTNTTFGSGVASPALCAGARGTATLNVGPNRALKGLADALNFLAPKTLKDVVVVKFDSGYTYSTPNLMPQHPQANLIYFIGDLNDASQVTLKQSAPSSTGYFLTFQSPSASFGSFVGFTLLPSTNPSASTNNAITVAAGAVLIGCGTALPTFPNAPTIPAGSNLILRNWQFGITVSGAQAYVKYIQMTGMVAGGLIVCAASYADIGSANLQGTSVAGSYGVQVCLNSGVGVSNFALSSWAQGFCINGGSWVENTGSQTFSPSVTTPWACSGSASHN